MSIYAILLATATFVEKQFGTMAAKMLLYQSPLFIFLHLLLVINFLLILFSSNYIKSANRAFIVIHLALIVILGGALTTFLFGKEGEVRIREGERTNQMVMNTSKGVKTELLPFELELKSFRLHRYPGSQSPSSYESDLLIHIGEESREAFVYMNNVLDLKGYRFFQASYDSDERGTVLSVNRDPVGRRVTYSGYLLLLLGFILMFFMPNSRFRRYGQELKRSRAMTKKVVVLIGLISVSFTGFSQNSSDRFDADPVKQNRIPVEHAERFGALPVQFRGRIMPMNSFSSLILRKVHKKTVIANLNSDQFLLSLFVMSHEWMRVPLIAIPNEMVSEKYNLPKGYAPYSYFFDHQGNYRLMTQLQEIYHRSAVERDAVEKDLIKLDEQVNILFQLFNLSMPGLFPDPNDPSHSWLSPADNLSEGMFGQYLLEVRNAIETGDWNEADRMLSLISRYQMDNDQASLIDQNKMLAEQRYNRMNIFNRCRPGYFIFGGVLLLLAFLQLFRERPWMAKTAIAVVAGIMVLFTFHLFGMGMRWYISGYAPWSNSYETMVYVAWATLLAGLIFGRKSLITLALATILGGVILFVSGLNQMDPEINPLVPVLKSPWLMFHVAVIVAAYGFFGISFLLGIGNISLMAFARNRSRLPLHIKELSIINNMSLLVGLALMTIGTFLGAVWANESWGRYWGWDPKETWALITIIVYSIVTHLHLVKKWNNDWILNLMSVLAFSSVLMTYFGVNYFLSGMHSYGHNEAVQSVILYIAVPFAIVAILGIVSFRKRSRFEISN